MEWFVSCAFLWNLVDPKNLLSSTLTLNSLEISLKKKKKKTTKLSLLTWSLGIHFPNRKENTNSGSQNRCAVEATIRMVIRDAPELACTAGGSGVCTSLSPHDVITVA